MNSIPRPAKWTGGICAVLLFVATSSSPAISSRLSNNEAALEKAASILDEKNGFREVKFGTMVADYPDMVPAPTQPSLEGWASYIRTGDRLTLFDEKISHPVYTARNGVIWKVGINMKCTRTFRGSERILDSDEYDDKCSDGITMEDVKDGQRVVESWCGALGMNAFYKERVDEGPGIKSKDTKISATVTCNTVGAKHGSVEGRFDYMSNTFEIEWGGNRHWYKTQLSVRHSKYAELQALDKADERRKAKERNGSEF